jgi:serine/threonine protein kinase
MPGIDNCPDLAELELLLLGNVSGPAADSLEQHLLACPSCARRLRGLAGEDRLLTALRGRGTATASADGSVEAVMERLRRTRPRDGESGTATALSGPPGRTVSPEELPRDARAILAPAQGPDELGRLGRYRVLKVLGAGGMGIVLEAEDTALRRPVALKVMKLALAAAGTAQQRFLQEARATAAVVHDHIVTIHDVDEAPAGGPEAAAGSVPFLAMQLLQGETLDARLKRQGLLPVPEVMRIGREIAAGLAAAHDKGLIHRDIKPANVWLEAPGGRVKILDFGLVRATGAAGPAPEPTVAPSATLTGSDQRLTQEGAIIGTPAYMAPEQALGRSATDARSDLFSLGCILYRLCTGRAAFEGADTAGTLLAVATHQPPAPRQLNPGVPPALSDLVMRLLAKRPEDRPPSAGHVVEAIRAIERDPTARRQRRHQLGQLLAAAAGVLLVLGLSGFWLVRSYLHRPAAPPDTGGEAAAPEGPVIAENYPDPPPAVAEVVQGINEQLRAGWATQKITPVRYVDDYEFIRRASLDIVGRIARPEEVAQYLGDPADKRRSLLIDRLLDGKEYAPHWAELWSGWLLARAGPLGRGVYREQMTAWLEGRFSRNTPYHEVAHALLTAEGENTRNGAVNFILAHVGERVPPDRRAEEGQFDMAPLTRRIAQLFLGMEIGCAQCHNHPRNLLIKREHFWALNAYFRQVEVKGNPGQSASTGPLTLVDNPTAASKVFFEKRDGKFFPANKPEYKRPDFLPPALNPGKPGAPRARDQLAQAFLEHDDFPRAIVNRMWAQFFGRGFINPIDNINEFGGVSPSCPELLDELAGRFKRSGYDLKTLIRWICNSEAYQLSCVTNETNARPGQETLFSRMVPRLMSPEQLFDSVAAATRVGAAEAQEGRKAARDAWLDSHTAACGDCQGNEIDFSGSMGQALVLMNGQEINEAIAARVKEVVALPRSRSPQAVVADLYLAALNRPPTAEETRRLRTILAWDAQQVVADPVSQYEDLLWALLNSNEFVLNH